MSLDDTLTLDPTPAPRDARPQEAAYANQRQERSQKQRTIRNEYLRAVAREAETRAAAGRRIAQGGLFLLIGLIVTLVTYARASTEGGLFVMAWGPVVFGLVQILRGVMAR
jgi:hypothetical protein